MAETTTDRNGAAVTVGTKVEYRLSDSARIWVGEVVEVLPSGGMYARNERSGFCGLVYPESVLVFVPAPTAASTPEPAVIPGAIVRDPEPVSIDSDDFDVTCGPVPLPGKLTSGTAQ